MAGVTGSKAPFKPKRPKPKPPALTPFEARCLRERYQGNAEVARWLASVPIRKEPA